MEQTQTSITDEAFSALNSLHDAVKHLRNVVGMLPEHERTTFAGMVRTDYIHGIMEDSYNLLKASLRTEFPINTIDKV